MNIAVGDLGGVEMDSDYKYTQETGSCKKNNQLLFKGFKLLNQGVNGCDPGYFAKQRCTKSIFHSELQKGPCGTNIYAPIKGF